MQGKVSPIPKGYHTITAHLVVRDAARMIEFYQQAFGAQVLDLMQMPDGKLMHGEVKIGDSIVMLAGEFPEWNALSPASLDGKTSVTIHMYVDDADAVFERAVAAGASVRMPMEDAFWGDRYGQVADPSGHVWSIATHTRDLTKEEMEQAAKAAFSGMQ